MKLNVLADTISTYLTLASALILPILLIVWVRSYLVSERLYRAEDGLAWVVGVTNGEVAVWAGPTDPTVTAHQRRSRQATWGWTHRRTFQRMAGTNHLWFLGFAYGQSERFPWRGMTLTGPATGVCMPLWFFTLIVAVMPCRLLARNMQSSEEFLAQRAAESVGAMPT